MATIYQFHNTEDAAFFYECYYLDNIEKSRVIRDYLDEHYTKSEIFDMSYEEKKAVEAQAIAEAEYMFITEQCVLDEEIGA